MQSLLKSIKMAALDAVQASDPVTVLFGTVESMAPLEINVGERFLLRECQLIQTRRVNAETACIGDNVLLLREQGGKKYVLLDYI